LDSFAGSATLSMYRIESPLSAAGFQILTEPDALQHPQPRGREVQFRLGAVLQHSRTPSLRVAGFEDEDDDEHEDDFDAPGQAVLA
jgi:hypothetical protein